MATRYIPPHLRNQQAPTPSSPGTTSSVSSQSTTPLYSRQEIHQHFWKNSSSQTPFNPDNTTLHASASSPDQLGYVLLFNGANPKWTPDNIIFVKSNLNLLPEVKASETPASDNPEAETAASSEPSKTTNDFPTPHPAFAVFTESFRGTGSSRSFKFLGWYRVSRLQYLEPQSEALVRMLHEKWTVRDEKTGVVKQRPRDARAWEASMKMRWAVVKMEVDGEAVESLGAPVIERIEEDGGKSVNELLKELRGGGADGV